MTTGTLPVLTEAYDECTIGDFRENFTDARQRDSRIGEATSPFTHVPGTRYYLAWDGNSGYAIRPRGELVFVFSLERGRGEALVADAVDRGAFALDCFDGYLPGLYARHGFTEVHREPNWTPGGPDVVHMLHPNNVRAYVADGLPA